MLSIDTSDWVQVCKVEGGELCFTDDFITATKELGGGRRKFISRLVGAFDGTTDTALDYFGPTDAEEDWYDGIDGHRMDVGEDVPDLLAYKGKPLNGLEGEWFRDLMRAKLATLKLPRRIIDDYIKIWKERF